METYLCRHPFPTLTENRALILKYLAIRSNKSNRFRQISIHGWIVAKTIHEKVWVIEMYMYANENRI